jgi:hypothetical protein
MTVSSRQGARAAPLRGQLADAEASRSGVEGAGPRGDHDRVRTVDGQALDDLGLDLVPCPLSAMKTHEHRDSPLGARRARR